MTITTITTADIADLGLKPHTFYRLARQGLYRCVLRGIWVPVDVPDSIEVRAAACARVVGPQHVLVDRAAAWLHGIDSFAWGERQVVPRLDVCAIRGHTRTRAETLDGGVRDLAEGDCCVVGGVRVTTPLRTAADLGCRLRRREAFAALNQFARLHGVSRAQLRRMVQRYKGRRGVVQLRELIELIDPRVESVRESWVLLALLDAGIAAPEPQLWIVIDGQPTYRLDFAWPMLRVCVEYDGVDAHDLTPEQRKDDAERRAWLRANGWTVIVIKAGDFDDQRLQAWLGRVREALRPSYDPRRW